MHTLFKRIVVAVLTWEAKRALKKYRPRIVAITGSVGKTGTKDAVFTALAHKQYVRKSQKSFNSELGVPLTILGLGTAWRDPIGWIENMLEGLSVAFVKGPYPEWLVLEVGADRPGDIKNLAWLRPHISVFTQFPDVPVHVEFFDGPEQVIAEKRELKHMLRPEGTLIVNADDAKMREEAVTEGQHLLSYGFAEHATVRILNAYVEYDGGGQPTGMAATVRFQDEEQTLHAQGVLGNHQFYPLVAALAVALSEGARFGDAVAALSEHAFPPGRMCLLPGKYDATLVDDSYNSSPAATLAGLDAFDSLQCEGKKIAVLGDMLELGEYSTQAHRDVGARVAQVADVFVGVGVRMRGAVEVAKAAGNPRVHYVASFKHVREAIPFLHDKLRSGDVLYIKGSQSMRMERLTEELLRDPSSAAAVLVRQDKEWKDR